MSSIAYAHWDIDGISSALILKNLGYLDDIFIPTVGVYWIEDEWFDILANYTEIYILDMTLSMNDLSILSRYSKVNLYDHSPHCKNVNSKNIHITCGEYPSTTYMLMKLFNLSPSIEIVLGLLNDVGLKIKRIPEWESFRNVVSNYGLDLNYMMKMIRLLNSPIYFNDLYLLYENIQIIKDRIFNIDKIPSLNRRREYNNTVDNEVKSLVTKASVKEDNYVYLEYYGDHYIIGTLPLKLYDHFNIPSIVVDHGYFKDLIQIASYNPNIDFTSLITSLRNLGYIAGGSKNFIGIICKHEELGILLERILKSF